MNTPHCVKCGEELIGEAMYLGGSLENSCHKDCADMSPKHSERSLFETAFSKLLPVGVSTSLKRKNGRYYAPFVQFHWVMWREARKTSKEER